MKQLGWVVSIILISSVVPTLSGIHVLYYPTIILFLIVIFYKKNNIVSIDRRSFIYLTICLFSLLLNGQLSNSDSYLRLIIYVVLFITFGTMVNNACLYKLRLGLLFHILYACLIITVISLFGFFYNKTGVVETDLGFRGITRQSMTMAPIASFSLLLLIYKMKSIKRNIYLLLFLLLIILSIIVSLLAGSRSSLVATVIAIIVTYYKDVFKFSVKYILLLVPLFYLTMPIWNTYLEVLVKKQEIQEKMADGGNSRSSKWDNRIAEFKSSPLYGIGFSSIDMENSSDDYDSEAGTIEYGSSWLSLFSSIGILGAISFITLYASVVYRTWKWCENDLTRSLLLSLLIYFGLHFVFEGYLFGVGNVLLIVFLLTLSSAYGYDKTIFLKHKYYEKCFGKRYSSSV